ncbi:hypothetical protein CH340_03120 [Rhodoplanes serenus]|nr:hypothetical protein CH340_03120 [Rhodoplanes serenus]
MTTDQLRFLVFSHASKVLRSDGSGTSASTAGPALPRRRDAVFIEALLLVRGAALRFHPAFAGARAGSTAAP